MKKPRHPVTDHAVIRYLERVQGMDIAAIRHRIGRVADRGIAAGAHGVISEGFVYRIEDGFVVTVALHHEPDKRIGRRRRRGA